MRKGHGVYELIRSDKFSRILERERIRAEFKQIEEFLTNLSTRKKGNRIERREHSAGQHEGRHHPCQRQHIGGSAAMQGLLAQAEENRIEIEVIIIRIKRSGSSCTHSRTLR